MLTTLIDWCKSNSMYIIIGKSNIVHFRPDSLQRSEFIFKCGESVVQHANSYLYLGITMTEHLDFSTTAICVAKSANRALGLLITKYKYSGGLHYDVYTKLYDYCVVPIITYDAGSKIILVFHCCSS